MNKEEIKSVIDKNIGKKVSINYSENVAMIGWYRKINDNEFEFRGIIQNHETKDEKNVKKEKFNIDAITHIRPI
ncbi:MAG: hypothetical protein AABY22_22680 [Nanoarchaeota archaeon]